MCGRDSWLLFHLGSPFVRVIALKHVELPLIHTSIYPKFPLEHALVPWGEAKPEMAVFSLLGKGVVWAFNGPFYYFP